MRDNATILRGIRKRGNSYQFTVSVGFDGDGKQVRHYMTYTPPANISETKRDKLVQEAYNEFRNKAEGNRAFKLQHNDSTAPTYRYAERGAAGAEMGMYQL